MDPANGPGKNNKSLHGTSTPLGSSLGYDDKNSSALYDEVSFDNAHAQFGETVRRRDPSPEEESPKKPANRAADSEATSIQDKLFPKREEQDVEAVHPVPSGPAYSVFSDRQRGYIVFMVACAGFFSPLSASIYFPALNALSKDLRVSNGLINLSLTTYMIFQGFAPTIFGDLADMTGRRPVYILGFIVYIGACVGLALQNNYAALLVLRCVQSAGSSGTIAIGSGVVGDIASSGERGKFMGALKSFMSKAHIDLFRHCSIWRNGSPCYSACSWRHFDRISRLEVDLLVLNNLSRSVSHTFGYHISRNRPQRHWQWRDTTSRLEHVPSQLPESQND